MIIVYKPTAWEQSLIAYVETMAVDPAVEAQCKSPDHLRWMVVAQRSQERQRLNLLTHLGLRGRKAQEELLRIEATLAPETPEEVRMWLEAAVCHPTDAMSAARWDGTAQDRMKRLRHATCASLLGWRRDVARTVRAFAAWNSSLAEYGAQQRLVCGFVGEFSLPTEQRVMLAVADAGAAQFDLRALRAHRLAGDEAYEFYLAVRYLDVEESVESVRTELDALLAES
jgi:hypothetical protein